MIKREAFFNKIEEKKGITILIALFVFLVCAILGITVFRAATAASSRVTNTALIDRYYYSADSLVKVINKLISEEPVKVIRTKVSQTKTRTTYTDDGVSVRHEDPYVVSTSSTFSSLFDETSPVEKNISLMNDVAIAYLFEGLTDFDDEIAWERSYRDFEGPSETFELAISSEDVPGLSNMVLSALINKNGELELSFDDDENDRYAIKYYFSPDISEKLEKSSVVNDPVVTKTGTTTFDEDVIVNETEVKETVVNWVFLRMEKD